MLQDAVNPYISRDGFTRHHLLPLHRSKAFGSSVSLKGSKIHMGSPLSHRLLAPTATLVLVEMPIPFRFPQHIYSSDE